MNAEELEIARRLVACKGWAWIPGMVALWLDDGEVIVRIRIEIIDERCAVVRGERYALRGMVPDLNDGLTRLGVLAVVRRAWGDDAAFSCPMDENDDAARAINAVPGWQVFAGNSIAWGRTELAALLAALEAAP